MQQLGFRVKRAYLVRIPVLVHVAQGTYAFRVPLSGLAALFSKTPRATPGATPTPGAPVLGSLSAPRVSRFTRLSATIGRRSTRGRCHNAAC
eukprot:6846509-Pyramimonas_sp.AAC.1